MQALVSPVDHESRHNSYREDDGTNVSERRPLLPHRYIRGSPSPSTNPTAAVAIAAMTLILIVGVVIAVYLLIQQDQWMPQESEDRPAFHRRFYRDVHYPYTDE